MSKLVRKTENFSMRTSPQTIEELNGLSGSSNRSKTEIVEKLVHAAAVLRKMDNTDANALVKIEVLLDGLI